MHPQNQIYAGLILMSHSLFIGIGMAIAFLIPVNINEGTEVGLDTSSLEYERQSKAQLLSWLAILELPHKEMLASKETVDVMLKTKSQWADFEFFQGVDLKELGGHLSRRLSVTENPNSKLRWKIHLSGATADDQSALSASLLQAYEERLQTIVEERDTPVEVGMVNHGAAVENGQDEALAEVFGKTVDPLMGALLAVVAVVLIWSFFLPSTMRKLPISLSAIVLLGAALACAFVGAAAQYVWHANQNPQRQSLAVVQIASQTSLMLETNPDMRSLIARIREKLNDPPGIDPAFKRGVIEAIVSRKKMERWKSFAPIAAAAKESGTHQESKTGFQTIPRFGQNREPPSVADYIFDRMVIEPEPDAADIFTIRFSCSDGTDACSVLTNFISFSQEYLDTANERWLKYAQAGAQLAPPRLKLNLFSSTDEAEKIWPSIGPDTVSSGAYLGAILALVLVSSGKVLIGVTPV
ncbi:hypothetical protein [Mariniblastus fucicola]|uniref:Uncharacterized protein n=2 Tax=Mariniblastus fucicola TaxID=980251 RepID=A0A5B9PBZ8_9BACT|nr:hypothetical protein [Mariniblastus fucicola]QEG23838.1 hypothetical protein MFFC18_37420 [Mariniblastus fucicola]